MAYIAGGRSLTDDNKNFITGNVVISGSTGLFMEATPPPPMYGTVSGFLVGGTPSPGPGGVSNEIQKFPFATNANATDYGDLTEYARSAAGQSSYTHGYRTGGNVNPPGANSNVIDKFPFASAANATDVGDITQSRYFGVGQSSPTHGYMSGGFPSNVIDKFPFASGGNATDVGDLTSTLSNSFHASGQSSLTSGYVSATNQDGYFRHINKFSFSSDGNATTIGTLAGSYGGGGSGQSSLTHGYNSGSAPFFGRGAYIEKFPFATDTNATKVADLYQPVYHASGQSSSVSGYVSGGFPDVNVIQKFPFSSDANSSDVGDLLRGMQYVVGQQD